MPDSYDPQHPNAPVREPEPAPRWVWTLGVIGLVLLVAFVLVHLVGGGLRGHSLPARGEHAGALP
jgi:hypothetical protein